MSNIIIALFGVDSRDVERRYDSIGAIDIPIAILIDVGALGAYPVPYVNPKNK